MAREAQSGNERAIVRSALALGDTNPCARATRARGCGCY